MSRGTDEETAPEYQEMLERMEHGEIPEESSKGPEVGGEGSE
jgi:hypothetical protein